VLVGWLLCCCDVLGEASSSSSEEEQQSSESESMKEESTCSQAAHLSGSCPPQAVRQDRPGRGQAVSRGGYHATCIAGDEASGKL
jgi:hypothetical protein